MVLSDLPDRLGCEQEQSGRGGAMSEQPPSWDVVIRIAITTDNESKAHLMVDKLLDKMAVTPVGTPIFVHYDDGTWAAEIHTDPSRFENIVPNDPLTVLSCLTGEFGPLMWRSDTDTPFDPDSARAGQMEWPPGYWALSGRKEVLMHPSVRSVLLRARQIR
jgi:hypothetical protein